jgi:hypothetical protein
MRNSDRGRGRRPGTGIRDEPLLYEIALRRAAEPQLGITPAIKQLEHLVVIKNTNHRRRIRNKYKEFEPMYGPVADLYLRAEEYDPARHSDAPIGTFARVKQGSALWPDMSRNGWHPVRGWRDGGRKDGEWIIQRQLCRLSTPKELHEQCAEYLAQIGPIEIDGGMQGDDEGLQ